MVDLQEQTEKLVERLREQLRETKDITMQCTSLAARLKELDGPAFRDTTSQILTMLTDAQWRLNNTIEAVALQAFGIEPLLEPEKPEPTI